MLAAEWVGTALAAWLGLRTLTVAMMRVDADDEIPLGHGRMASPGPAIVSRAEPGGSWGGSVDELRAVENPGDVALFVVLDTWLRNCDRYPADLTARKPNYDNVFLSSSGAAPGRFNLMAIDHTHCFDCGRDLNARLCDIDKVKDPRVYGRFPEFDQFLSPEGIDAALRRLSTLSRTTVESLLGELPDEWQVPSTVKAPFADLICDRANYVSGTLASTLFPKR